MRVRSSSTKAWVSAFPPYTRLFTTFTLDHIELFRMDIQHLRRLRRPLLDLT